MSSPRNEPTISCLINNPHLIYYPLNIFFTLKSIILFIIVLIKPLLLIHHQLFNNKSSDDFSNRVLKHTVIGYYDCCRDREITKTNRSLPVILQQINLPNRSTMSCHYHIVIDSFSIRCTFITTINTQHMVFKTWSW